MPGLIAIVPAKRHSLAKQRLAGILDAGERSVLAIAMFHDVVGTLRKTSAIEHIVVITADADFASIARAYDAEIMLDRWETGVTRAVQEAAIAMSARGAGAVLAIPADVPLVQPFEIDKILAAHSGPGITIVPADTDQGSNAIVASPPTAIPFCFGPNSFFAHVEQARKRGLIPRVVRSPGLCLDVDRPPDLHAVLSSALPTHAKAFLSKIERNRLRSDGPGSPAVRASSGSGSGRE